MTSGMRGDQPHVWEVAIIGAGAGGIALGARLRKAGIEDFVVFERDDGVGGTWRANRYPGAACDVPSHLYSFSFALKPDWSRTYATQPEILEYLEDCTDRFGLRPHLRCGTGIIAVEWLEAERHWRLTDQYRREHRARVVVSAVGMFTTPAFPAIDGLASFEGPVVHSARWTPDLDLAGRRVGVIGTGASSVQIVPAIADEAAEVRVFQRSPAWIFPRYDPEIGEDDKRRFARNPIALRRHRWQIYKLFEDATVFRVGDPKAEGLEQIARDHLERKVTDPDLRARLTPDFPIGCKRILVSSDYYRALQRDDVALVTDPIARIDATGVVTADPDGEAEVHHDLDVVVLATGFRATEYLHNIDVRGRDGRRLRDEWAGRPRAHLGMTVAGFPNLFVLYGPNTNQGGNSLIFILEAQARYVVAAVRRMRRRRLDSIEIRRRVMDRYNRRLDAALAGTVWTAGCDNYFRTADGHVATQLPHPSRWYWARTRLFRLGIYQTTRRRS